MKKRTKSEFDADRTSQETSLRALIRATLIEERLGILDTDDEYIEDLIRGEGEASPDNSLTDIHAAGHRSPRLSKTKKSEDSKIHKGHASANFLLARASVPEWQILRLFSAVGGGFDLEMWWRRSDANNRLIALLVVSLFLVALLNLGFAIAFIASSFITEVPKSPYICESGDCKTMSVRFLKSMNMKVLPCDNFYEFMCGNYSETQVEGPIFADLITKPSFKVELGTDNIIGRVLKHNNDSQLNTQIKFFQTCLNFVNRANFSHDTLTRNVATWFGTSNFALFEEESENNDTLMNQIAVNLFQAFGHASFINIGFYTYPYILILEPHNRTTLYRKKAHPQNPLFLRNIFGGLMGHLGLNKSNLSHKNIINDMVNGTHVMSTVIHRIYAGVKAMENIPEDEDPNQEKIREKIELFIKDNLTGLCPPMGEKMNIMKVLESFISDDEYKLEYNSPTARKYFLALETCFDKPPREFIEYTIKHRRTAFVSLWILDIFLSEILLGLNYKNMINDWGLDNITEDHAFVGQLKDLSVFNDEYVCLDTMWTVLGYLPTVRFLKLGNLGFGKDVLTWKDDFEKEITNSYPALLDHFLEIPPKEIDWREMSLARIILKRGFHVDIGLPLVAGILGIEAEALNFTNDFLENVLIGFRYTISRARQDWLGSTNPKPVVKWFADGGPGNIKDTLFVPHYIRADSARLQERELAAKSGEWETFLGRKHLNYIRLPLSIFDDRNAEVGALQYAFIVLPVYHAMFALVRDATSREKYPSLDFEKMLGLAGDWDEEVEHSDRNCSMLDTSLESSDETRNEYKMIPSNVSHYTWEKEELFLATVSAKLALLSYQRWWKKIITEPYNFKTREATRNFVQHRLLPGEDLKNYTGAQLFFMGYARQICRESWKSKDLQKLNELKEQQHYSLESTFLNVLMQMEEFSEAFNCTRNSMMNNKGQPRCFIKRWHLEDENDV